VSDTVSFPEQPGVAAPVVIIGAGPAGLTAAYELARLHRRAVVFERDAVVGGLARTVLYKGFRFDIGGHRFFTKARVVQELWRHVLGSDLLTRPRLSRIYYRKTFFDYPLRAGNALRGLGPLTMLSVIGSYLYAQLDPIRPERSFADWVSNRFGRKLYRIFFESYTYKVWGIPPSQIDARWAAQRIRGLSLWSAAWHMLGDAFGAATGNRVRTLIDQFEYPRLGPGMMWEAVAAHAIEGDVPVVLGTAVVTLHHQHSRLTSIEVSRNGKVEQLPCSGVISTMPLRELIQALSPPAPEAVQTAANRLNYRDFLTVALIIDAESLFPDNWIYIHDPGVRVGRIQNFKNWSPEMVPDRSKTCLGLEYFCFEHDELWAMQDTDLIALASQELATLGLLNGARVVDGVVVRVPKAYPVYDAGYQEALDKIRAFLDGFTNLQVVGRNGMHRYNNQDHSMLTAMLAVRNLEGEDHDIWNVNADDEYHESGESDSLGQQLRVSGRTQPLVPRQLSRTSRD
jgi:protoporphyrinogen oxidase